MQQQQQQFFFFNHCTNDLRRACTATVAPSLRGCNNRCSAATVALRFNILRPRLHRHETCRTCDSLPELLATGSRGAYRSCCQNLRRQEIDSHHQLLE